MIATLCIYLAISLVVGVVALLGFTLDWRFCVGRWYSILMLVFFPSWLFVVAPLVAYGFYMASGPHKGRKAGKGGAA